MRKQPLMTDNYSRRVGKSEGETDADQTGAVSHRGAKPVR